MYRLYRRLYIYHALSHASCIAIQPIQPIQPIQLYSYTAYTVYISIQLPSDLVLAGSKSGRATRFSLAQMKKTWSRRPDLGVSGPEVRPLAQRSHMGNSIWPRAAFSLVGGGFFGRADAPCILHIGVRRCPTPRALRGAHPRTSRTTPTRPMNRVPGSFSYNRTKSYPSGPRFRTPAP